MGATGNVQGRQVADQAEAAAALNRRPGGEVWDAAVRIASAIDPRVTRNGGRLSEMMVIIRSCIVA